jgi:lambda repressor-like predicted transcriptional regulator
VREIMQTKRGEGLRELARSFGVSYDVLWRAAKDGRLKTINIGGRIVCPASEIARIEREGLALRAQAAGAEAG